MPHAIQIRQTGGPEVLNWTAVDVDEPGSGQVRLRQAAASLNYIEVYRRTGYYPQPLPFIPGLQGAGTVEAVAQDVRGSESRRSGGLCRSYRRLFRGAAHRGRSAGEITGGDFLRSRSRDDAAGHDRSDADPAGLSHQGG